MSPVNHVNTHYSQMIKKGREIGMNESKYNIMSSRESDGEDYMRRSQATSIASPPTRTKKRGVKRAPGIPKMLEDLHKPVNKVSMVGLNSHLNFSIDFVATPKGKVNSLLLG